MELCEFFCESALWSSFRLVTDGPRAPGFQTVGSETANYARCLSGAGKSIATTAIDIIKTRVDAILLHMSSHL